ncbi:NAD(P)/FAD-dependent oxidoreductase [Streptacidiphilus fuscans]|uniref:FAD-dependent oxidoreductase n=1 Tax=Streptacidiphilus fuscans TaxID=2789292 RepID=A0A931B6Y9_9ACTN|nr:FAD-dependent oxidoreductase [Streptacidiphilus fuscans]MBF9071574.1 FAD-dependent oxidoreductase [Streptacidiphilus fuscans]
MNRVVVVGAAAGGLATADSLRQQGFAGHITLIGDELHLPYDRPPLSKQLLTGQWEPEQLLLRSESDIGALGLDLRLGVAATSLDPRLGTVTLADGSAVRYDALVIATGVRPRPFPGGENTAGVHVLRTVEDALTLRDRLQPGRRLVVVGGGFVGTEVAAAARQRGVDVALVEPEPVPLARSIGEDAGRFLAELHLSNGVRIHTGVRAVALDTSGGAVTGVRLDDGRQLPADDVLVATGTLPNTDWLRGSGLDVSDGVVCDAYSRCAPGVHAVGDVARWYNGLFGCAMRVEHRATASEQGISVAHNILYPASPRPFTPVPYFWTDQYHLKIQSYGYLRGHEETALLDGDLADGRALIGYRRGRRLSGVLSINMPFKAIRPWRTALTRRTEWADAVPARTPAR